MTIEKALRTLRSDAAFLGMHFEKYMETVAKNRESFPQIILEAYDFYTEGEVNE